MWTIKKITLLSLLLVVPLLVFFWIRFAGENHYSLPRYFPLLDSLDHPLLVKNPANRPWWQPETDTLFHTIPPFKLLNQDSILVDETLVKGKIYVADFFFSRCPTICPKMTASLGRVQEMFKQNPEVLILSHTIDPIHDTPARLRAYAREHDAIKDKWVFLTGEKEDIYKLSIKGYKLAAQDDNKNGPPSETFYHDSKLVLIDKTGTIRGYYDGTDRKEVDRLSVEIKVLLDIYKKQTP